jgi:hypothetical protein
MDRRLTQLGICARLYIADLMGATQQMLQKLRIHFTYIVKLTHKIFHQMKIIQHIPAKTSIPCEFVQTASPP